MKFVHVPYRGAAPALTDLLGGQVQLFAADAPVLMSNIRGGKIRALGAASGQRNPMLSDVPTLAEQGYPNIVVDNWYGLLAPAKTPPAIIAKINDAFVKAINDPVVKKRLIDHGAIPVADAPSSLASSSNMEYDRWGKVVTCERHEGVRSFGAQPGPRPEMTGGRFAIGPVLARVGLTAAASARRRVRGSFARTGFARSSSSLTHCIPVEQLDQDNGANRTEGP